MPPISTMLERLPRQRHLQLRIQLRQHVAADFWRDIGVREGQCTASPIRPGRHGVYRRGHTKAREFEERHGGKEKWGALWTLESCCEE